MEKFALQDEPKPQKLLGSSADRKENTMKALAQVFFPQDGIARRKSSRHCRTGLRLSLWRQPSARLSGSLRGFAASTGVDRIAATL